MIKGSNWPEMVHFFVSTAACDGGSESDETARLLLHVFCAIKVSFFYDSAHTVNRDFAEDL